MVTPKIRALVVDDEVSLRFGVRGLLEHLSLEVTEAPDALAALAALSKQDFQLVVTDIQMPRMSGIELLQKIRERPNPPKVIVMTAHGSERQAVEAMRLGAFDYFKKPFEVEELLAVVGRATESVRLNAEVERLSSELTLGRSLIFGSESMSRLAVMVQRIAPRDVTVLLSGESGTGKERVAEALVQASNRRDKPFLRFNCAALTAELAEAELFGHSKGAFTGAVKSRLGLFREAEGGTVLLDEVAELPAPIQAKLLRVLQEDEVRPVGEDQPVKINVRIIAATHRDLLQMSAEGKFREDLYYRLKVVQLRIPSLRERPEDIPLLARHFLGAYSRRFSVGPFKLTAALLERLTSYTWPGNVREMENAIESLVALSHSDLDLSLLPEPREPSEPKPNDSPEPAESPRPKVVTGSPKPAEAVAPRDLKLRVDAYERGIIASTLEETQGNRSQAARLLGINRATLQGKLRKYGLSSSDADADTDAE